MTGRLVCVDGTEHRLTGDERARRTGLQIVAQVAGSCVGMGHGGGVSARTPGMSLFWRVFVLNAAVFVIGTGVLALSPAPVRLPVTVVEAILLAVGLLAILLVNLVLLRRSLGPLERLRNVVWSHPGVPSSGETCKWGKEGSDHRRPGCQGKGRTLWSIRFRSAPSHGFFPAVTRT